MARAFEKINEPGRGFGVRKIYISWGDCAWAKPWVYLLHEKLSPICYDESNNAIETVLPLPHEIQAGSIAEAEWRELRARVTDVVVVFTSAYIGKQQRQFKSGQPSELLLFIDRKEGDERDSLTLWLAPLEGLKLKHYQIGEKSLGRYTWWHWLKGKEEKFKYLGTAENPQYTTGFIQELDDAIDRLLAHVPRNCEQCWCEQSSVRQTTHGMSSDNAP